MTVLVPRVTAQDALHLARRVFLRPERLDMRALALSLGIGRATLYRWVGSRDDVHVDILWWLTKQALARRRSQVRPDDPQPLAHLLGGFVRDAVTYPPMRRFLDEEGDYAVRLLILAEHGFHPRLVAFVRELVEDEVRAGRCRAPAAADELAYAAVRLVESFVHQSVLAGRAPDADAASRVLVSLLR